MPAYAARSGGITELRHPLGRRAAPVAAARAAACADSAAATAARRTFPGRRSPRDGDAGPAR